MQPNFAQVIAFLSAPTIAHVLDYFPQWNKQSTALKQFGSLVLTAGGSYLAYWLTSNVNPTTEAAYDPLIGVAITLASFLVGQWWHSRMKAQNTATATATAPAGSTASAVVLPPTNAAPDTKGNG